MPGKTPTCWSLQEQTLCKRLNLLKKYPHYYSSKDTPELIEVEKAIFISIWSKMDCTMRFILSTSPKSTPSKHINDADALAQLLDRIEYADQAGLDVFGIGEHMQGFP
jgi:hypothetical protein